MLFVDCSIEAFNVGNATMRVSFVSWEENRIYVLGAEMIVETLDYLSDRFGQIDVLDNQHKTIFLFTSSWIS